MTLQKAIKILEAEYERGKMLSFVRRPLAWALHRVWRMADEEKDNPSCSCADSSLCTGEALGAAEGRKTRLVDVNELKGIIQEVMEESDFQLFKDVMRKVCDILEKSPTVDAVEVVHGRWEHNEYGLQCSKCACDSLHNGFNHPVRSAFCPNCGAKMDGDGNV